MIGSLDDRVAIVTGAGHGIGLATARLLAEHGAAVLLVDLDAEPLDAAVEAIDGDVAALQADVTGDLAPEEVIAAALERWGTVDILVNNAGYALDGPIEELTDEAFRRMLDIHLVAPFRLCRALAPHLRATDPGHHRKVVNVSSIDGLMGAPEEAGYVAGKAGVLGLTKGLAKEWAGLRVNVNAVAPGYTDTRMTRELHPDRPAVAQISGRRVPLGVPRSLREEIVRLNPLGRFGTVAEVAGTIAFLCSSWSDYINGQAVVVSGGQPAGMSA